MKESRARVTFWVTLVTLGAAFGAPLAMVAWGGFFQDGHFTARFLLGVFRNPIYGRGLLNSLGIGVGTTLLATLIAMPLAVVNYRYEYPGKRFLSGVLLAPLVLPPFVGAIGLTQILGQYGAMNSLLHLGAVDWLGRARFWGVVGLEGFGLYPIAYLNLSAALGALDPAMEEAAANLGAGRWRRLRRITIPLLMPGLFAGGTLIFIWSFTELGTPLMLNFNRCAPVQVFDALKEIGNNNFPYALVFVMLSASVAAYLVTRIFFGGRSYAAAAKAGGGRGTARGGWLMSMGVGGVCLVALLPHVAVVLLSFSPSWGWYRTVVPSAWTTANYSQALGDSGTLVSIRNSLVYSGLAVVVDVTLGVAIALVVVRSTIRLRWLLDAAAMLPLAAPGLVMAFGYLAISAYLSRLGWVKESLFWKNLVDAQTNPTTFLVVAYAVRRLPYVVRSAVAGLEQTSAALEEAAANLGASGWRILRKITVPLIMGNLVAGALLAFAFSMLEVSDSLMLAQRSDYFPITKQIYELDGLLGDGKFVACALGVWAMAFLGVTILGAAGILGKRMGALFKVS